MRNEAMEPEQSRILGGDNEEEHESLVEEADGGDWAL